MAENNTPSSYIERLKMSDADIAQSTASARAAEVEAELGSRIGAKQAQIVRLNNTLDGIISRYPLDFGAVTAQQEKINEAEASLEALQDIYRNLFPG